MAAMSAERMAPAKASWTAVLSGKRWGGDWAALTDSAQAVRTDVAMGSGWAVPWVDETVGDSAQQRALCWVARTAVATAVWWVAPWVGSTDARWVDAMAAKLGLAKVPL